LLAFIVRIYHDARSL